MKRRGDHRAWRPMAVLSPEVTSDVRFACERRSAQSRGRAPVGASLRLLRGPAGHVPCGARSRGPVAELAAFATLSTLGQLRRVSSRGALRARATRPALLGAAEARRRAPAHGFADQHLFVRGFRRDAGIEPARAGAAARCPLRLPLTKSTAVPAKSWPGGGRSASAAPSSAAARGRARSAPRHRTRRDCPSVESAANAASFATGHEARAAQETWPAGPRTSRS